MAGGFARPRGGPSMQARLQATGNERGCGLVGLREASGDRAASNPPTVVKRGSLFTVGTPVTHPYSRPACAAANVAHAVTSQRWP